MNLYNIFIIIIFNNSLLTIQPHEKDVYAYMNSLLKYNTICTLQVYKKVWLAENSESDAMRVVYRMRGLLGDATEEFVETLDKKKEEDVDNEQVYRMAGVMCQCAGLEVRK